MSRSADRLVLLADQRTDQARAELRDVGARLRRDVATQRERAESETRVAQSLREAWQSLRGDYDRQSEGLKRARRATAEARLEIARLAARAAEVESILLPWQVRQLARTDK